jgi:DNA-binding NarL/FixJ family response regulator
MERIEELLIRIEAKLDVLLSNKQSQTTPVEDRSIIKDLLSFTPKQHAVIQMVWGNVATEAMADVLGVSISTIKVHIRGVMRKTGYKSRAQIAMMAEEMLGMDAVAYERGAGIPQDWYVNRDKHETHTKMLQQKVR